MKVRGGVLFLSFTISTLFSKHNTQNILFLFLICGIIFLEQQPLYSVVVVHSGQAVLMHCWLVPVVTGTIEIVAVLHCSRQLTLHANKQTLLHTFLPSPLNVSYLWVYNMNYIFINPCRNLCFTWREKVLILTPYCTQTICFNLFLKWFLLEWVHMICQNPVICGQWLFLEVRVLL